ncbi:MAG: GGDEF domain-containing protein [Sphaerochaetaceae bacterium]
MMHRGKEHLIAFVVALAIFLLFFFFTVLGVFYMQNIGTEKEKHVAELELQVIHERLQATLYQQTKFLKFLSTTVTHVLQSVETVDTDDFRFYEELLQQNNRYYSSMLLVENRDIIDVLPKEATLMQQEENSLALLLQDSSQFQTPVFLGPYESENNELIITGYSAIASGKEEPGAPEQAPWGYIVIHYNYDQLLAEAGTFDLLKDYEFSIRVKDIGGMWHVVYGDDTLLKNDILQTDFSYSLLDWELILIPLQGWTVWTNITILLLLAGIVVAIFLGVVGFSLTKRIFTMRRQVCSDDMTGVLNKTEFIRILKVRMDQYYKTGTRIALALLDIDNFKSINDQYGHAEGDRALLALVQRITQTVQPYDVVGRLGGDEFAILFCNLTTETAPYIASKRVFRELENLHIEGASGPIHIQTSMGVAIAGIDALDVHGLLKQADTALYTAKANGKNMLAFS